jgi:hypothetical protein
LIFLRAKHARDRRFAFLFPEDPFPSAAAHVAADSGEDHPGDMIGAVDSLYAYFRFLCDTGAADAEADAQQASTELGSGGDWVDELLCDAQRWTDLALQAAAAATTTAADTAPNAAVSAGVVVVSPPIDAMAALADYADSDDDGDDDGKATAIAAKEAPATTVGKWQHLLEPQEESGISGSASSSDSKSATGAGSGSDAQSLPRDPFAHMCDVLSAHPSCFARDCVNRLECIVGGAPEGCRTPRQRLAYDLVSRLEKWMKHGP